MNEDLDRAMIEVRQLAGLIDAEPAK
ncbi:MAG: hypothetical protein ACI8TQ_001332 [Planctomycetota bacterium]